MGQTQLPLLHCARYAIPFVMAIACMQQQAIEPAFAQAGASASPIIRSGYALVGCFSQIEGIKALKEV